MEPEWVAVGLSALSLLVAVAASVTATQSAFLGLLTTRREETIDELYQFCTAWEQWAHGRSPSEMHPSDPELEGFSLYGAGPSEELARFVPERTPFLKGSQYRSLGLKTIQAYELFFAWARAVYQHRRRLSSYTQIRKTDEYAAALHAVLDDERGSFLPIRILWDRFCLKKRLKEYAVRASLQPVAVSRAYRQWRDDGRAEYEKRTVSMPYRLLLPNEATAFLEFQRVHTFMNAETPLDDDQVRDRRLIDIRKRLIAITAVLPGEALSFLSERRVWESETRLLRSESLVEAYLSADGLQGMEIENTYNGSSSAEEIFLEDTLPLYYADMGVLCSEDARPRPHGTDAHTPVYSLSRDKHTSNDLAWFGQTVTYWLKHLTDELNRLWSEIEHLDGWREQDMRREIRLLRMERRRYFAVSAVAAVVARQSLGDHFDASEVEAEIASQREYLADWLQNAPKDSSPA